MFESMSYEYPRLRLVDMIRFAILTNLAMIITGCTGIIGNSQTRLSITHVGWYYGSCLVIKASDLSRGTVMTLVDAEAAENRFRSKIIASAKNADECSPLAGDRKNVNAEDGKSFYLISKPKEIQAETTFDFGIAVVFDAQGSLLPVSEMIDLNNDGLPDSFSYCAASEGISFDAWSAIPYKSKNLWSGYYYLGYDIESNCPEK